MVETRLLGIGAAALLPCDGELPLPEHHPLANPGLLLEVSVDAGVVTQADPRIGLMHRSAEKLFESRDLRQAMALADRHDWLSAASSEINVALACEQALGIIPPERATWIRTLVAELNRVTVALAFLAPIAPAARAEADALRERLVAVQERITGARVHPGFARIGGVAAPIDEESRAEVVDATARLRGFLPRLGDAVDESTAPLAGIAVLPREQAIAFGVGGPVGRASGLDRDLRRDEPYLAYAELADVLEVCVDTVGDARARHRVLVRQLGGSLAMVEACVDRLRSLGDGPVDVPLPKVVRLPEGTTYAWTEGPIGVTGCLLVGAGDKYPWRMKIRSASFANLQAMAASLPGTPADRLAGAVLSFPAVLGDADR